MGRPETERQKLVAEYEKAVEAFLQYPTAPGAIRRSQVYYSR
jgi:hypothetical protein